MRATKDIAWLGGLLEGEASFMVKGGSPIIALQMTDRDTMQRAAEILDSRVGAYARKPKGKSTYKPVWHLAVHGSRAIAWMMTLYQFLGERRQEKVREVIAAWRASKYTPRLQGRHRLPATCHPDRPRKGALYCAECYKKDWMQKWRKKTGRNGTHYRHRAEEAAT